MTGGVNGGYGLVVLDWLPLLTALIGAAAGSVLGPMIATRQRRDDWLRDKRAVLYGEYAEAAQAVLDVVNYDDQINLRLGNEKSAEHLAAWESLDRATARLKVYGSPGVGEMADQFRGLFLRWDNAGLVPVSTPDPEDAAWVAAVERRGGQAMRLGSPVDPSYPWPAIEQWARELTNQETVIIEAIRMELDVESSSRWRRIARRP